MSFQMPQPIEEDPTCRECGEVLNEDRDEIGICLSCEEEAARQQRLQDERDYGTLEVGVVRG